MDAFAFADVPHFIGALDGGNAEGVGGNGGWWQSVNNFFSIYILGRKCEYCHWWQGGNGGIGGTGE